MRIDELNTLISAVCPILGVNSDGVITFDPSATPAQKTAAQTVMAANLPLLTQPPSIAQLQMITNAAIDQQAGITRLKYITDVPGQSETYAKKEADANAYKAAGYPFASLASYSWVQAEAIAINGSAPTATQAQAAADGIIATASTWAAKGAAIEQARRAGKIAVAAATTVSAVQSAQTAAISALQAL